MPALCSLCAFDEFTTEGRTPDGVRFVSCGNPEHGDEPYVWEPPEPTYQRNREGIGADLDVWDKLLTCVNSGEPAIPYGIVEDRFFEQHPSEALTLIKAYGHKWRDPEYPSGQFSMSVYLAARLSELADDGDLVKTFGPAEGPWAYNGIISWWRVAGDEPEEVEPADADTTRKETPGETVREDEVERLVVAARDLPPAEGEYTETDYVLNLMATVLDYQMHSTAVVNAIEYFKAHRWDEVRSLEDLEERFTRHPDTKEGNTALANSLWNNNHWTRAHQLRDLAAFFRSIDVVDQDGLVAWASTATFARDFEGQVRGLGPAIFQWLVMRQGVDTVKPDVHVRRFAEGVLGRALGDTELIALVSTAAERMPTSARELDWAIWEASRRGDFDQPG